METPDGDLGTPVGPTLGALRTSVDWVVDLLAERAVVPDEAPPDDPRKFDAAWHVERYRRWVAEVELGPAEADRRAALPTQGPLVSVVVPVYRPEPWYFRRCVESVLSQSYQDWELCLCDDNSSSPELTAILTEYMRRDPRVKVVVHERNGGISRATNSAAAIGQGELVALLDHDDALAPTALAEVADALRRHEDADVLYSDEDKLDWVDRRLHPHFKPDWSPDLLLAFPYLGHLLVVRRALLERVGGFRPEFDGSQDYDVMMRVTEQARRVVHIPKVLYHWRTVEGSAASAADAKPWAHDASRRVVESTMVRTCVEGHIEDGPFPGSYHVRRRLRAHPLVSVVIPFRDQAALTVQCLRSLEVAPGYDNVEVVLVDNDSTEPETLALRQRLIDRPTCRIVDAPGPFNWSKVNNLGVAASRGELLLFLNNDIEATGDGWLHALVEHALRPEVGAVGARLLFPNHTLQHAGVVLGLSGVAGHVLSGIPSDAVGYMGWDRLQRPYSAVTAACLMCRRQVFDEIGGFDEDLAVAYNDVDFCMRLVDAGYRVVYTPLAELVHHESLSRGISGQSRDRQTFLTKWTRPRLHDDPFFNPNLSLFSAACAMRFPDEEERWNQLLDVFLGRPVTETAPGDGQS